VRVSRSSCAQWTNLGYQANVYYAGFRTPPAGAMFSREWGFQRVSLEGDQAAAGYRAVPAEADSRGPSGARGPARSVRCDRPPRMAQQTAPLAALIVSIYRGVGTSSETRTASSSTSRSTAIRSSRRTWVAQRHDGLRHL
jgi:hypothetical protein